MSTDHDVDQPVRALAPILLIGAGGMLGRAWLNLLERRAIAHWAPSRSELDLLDRAQVEACVKAGWKTIINCAAWTDVDGAEADEAGALNLNACAVQRLAAAAVAGGATLVHFSTDYVFDGQASDPVPIRHPRAPLNAYGRSKAEGERAIEASGCRALIVRTSWLYASWGHNFVRTIARLARERDTLRVVDDQRGRPTSAEHLAEVTLRLLEQGRTGIWHVSDGGACSWYEFARAIVDIAGITCSVSPCSSDEFPRPAPRPAFSVLDLSETERAAGPMPDWRDNLRAVITRLENNGGGAS